MDYSLVTLGIFVTLGVILFGIWFAGYQAERHGGNTHTKSA